MRGTDNISDDNNPDIPATATCFATINIADGLNQIPLDENSSKMTTFLLPSGRYRHLVAPKGLITPHKAWNEVKHTLTNNSRWATHNPDTIIIHAPNYLHWKEACNPHNINLQVTKNKEDTNKLVMCGSKILTKQQANYATAELEALAVLYTCQSCKHQLQGIKSFEVRMTYRPLQGLFQQNMHEMNNTRLLRIREKLADFSFTIQWSNEKQK